MGWGMSYVPPLLSIPRYPRQCGTTFLPTSSMRWIRRICPSRSNFFSVHLSRNRFNTISPRPAISFSLRRNGLERAVRRKS